jgi:tRNA G18 (ribose-2'-O)-methylase SpoU
MSFIVIVDNIRSAHNVGSIFRTADGAGADKIYLVGVSPTPPTKETVYLTRAHKDLAKTALGAEKNIPWEYCETAEAIMKILKHDGYTIVALEQSEKSEDYRAYQPSEKVALMVGNEVDGVSADVLRQCDAILEIPMRGQKNSLNVSVAFGIASFEIRSKLEI